jgi:hypothetical protein
VRRERIALPLLRDERPETVLRQLERIVRERAGISIDEIPLDGRALDTAVSPAPQAGRPARRAGKRR